MTSFWNTSENEKINSTGQAEMGGGDIAPIPNNTDVLAAVDEAGWDNNVNNGDHIVLRWNILQPKEYANRKVWQRLKVMDDDDKKADKAKRMLAAIDANAGGKLMASGEQPDDAALMKALLAKPMVLKLMQWKMEARDTNDGVERSGNWVSAVSPRNKKAAEKKPEPKQEAERPGDVDSGDVGEDDILW